MNRFDAQIPSLNSVVSLQQGLQSSIRHLPIKRGFDILFSVSVLLFGLPLFALIALLVWISSPGPIIFTHKRIGRGGKPFFCYKFRTMRQDAESYLQRLLDAHPELSREWADHKKLRLDPRITAIGWFLRKTSLDEFPQFWNVLRGDLSVVGPRPVIHTEITEHYGSSAHKILSIRPGITGLWQISGRNETTYGERIRLDKTYVDQRSLALDLKIILKTVPIMFVGKGAY